ncbi:MAG: sodium/proton-translocating pyrophosphatase, partial [Lentisphaerae bacterium]|nr:sodium/proton-translocating pyrophosphatase [Lentisphaerota bacterium]
GLVITAIISLILIGLLTQQYLGFDRTLTTVTGSFTGMSLYLCGVTGLAVTGLLVWITEYYTGTGYRPVREIAKASVTGHGTNVIQGLAVSMESTALPALVIVWGIIVAYTLAGLFGIAIATTTMLALAGMIVALDAFGPVTDNAGGIAEMAGLDKDVRKTTDALDAVGNTTKAVTKGYAIGSAGLGALVLFAAYTADLGYFREHATETQYSFFLQGGEKVAVSFSLANPWVVVGLFLGGMLPYLFASMGMTAVGRAASAVVEEVRRQFKEKPGIMKGTDKPDYARCVQISTKGAQKAMMLPALMAITVPVACGLVLGIPGIMGLLAGSLAAGFSLACLLNNAGGAWDNAKKHIEKGNLGGKYLKNAKGEYVDVEGKVVTDRAKAKNPRHGATVIGDTVGDPFKDTAGPSLNILLKLMSMVAIVFTPVILRYSPVVQGWLGLHQ